MAAELGPRYGQMNDALEELRDYTVLTTAAVGRRKRPLRGPAFTWIWSRSGQTLRQQKRDWEARMAQAAVKIFEQEGAAPQSAVLDRAHLTRMTFNDVSLEREVLQLFDRQAELLMERMRESEPAAIATLAHTLKGSAAGIGAVRVARAAAATELVASSAPGECSRAIDQLAQAVDEARIEIVALLRMG
jgi:HPt (histidine-containing phosphotransfer) domain-containing protein